MIQKERKKRKKRNKSASQFKQHPWFSFSIRPVSSSLQKQMGEKPSSSNSHLLIGKTTEAQQDQTPEGEEKKKCRICYTLKARLSGVLPGRRFCRSRCNAVRLGRKLTSEERRYIIWISKPLPGPVPIVSSGYHPALEDQGRNGISTARHLIILRLMSLSCSNTRWNMIVKPELEKENKVKKPRTWQKTAKGSLSGPSHESSLVLPSMKVPSAKIT